MVDLELLGSLAVKTPSKMVLLVLDGLGGLPNPINGKTELEAAYTPNLDRLLQQGACGLTDPVGTGITSGSAPGILALLGYDPLKYTIGRGALEAVGIDFDLQEDDVAARGNFCTIDESGIITDRRAGRITTDKCAELSRLLSKINLGTGVEIFVLPVEGHRFALVLRGKGLSADVSDSDPQKVGYPPKSVKPLSTEAGKTARLVNKFIEKSWKLLRDHHPANMILVRGFSRRPHHPSLASIYQIEPACIASYPMYRGLARLVGMKLLDTGPTIQQEFQTFKKHYAQHDFFFIHVKATDMAGEDGDFDHKVSDIQEVDRYIPEITQMNPDVIMVTGDHSTPAALKGHSWHPVPFLLYSKWCRKSRADKFCERECASGELGRMPAQHIMALALAHALKLTKYGA
ncbi:MAG: 2,3-bisphosphoglycerate-independent phosphoglycerate mutase [Chloroflexi bacterium]|nr:2,3-bisphosphoglycerate-independent phosphoglycerate mutase [Chloroflexota bacterium]